MYRFALAFVMVMPTVFVTPMAHAQYYNPFRSQYREWNQGFPGYRDVHSDVRRQIREMNPYGPSFREYQRELRRSTWW